MSRQRHHTWERTDLTGAHAASKTCLDYTQPPTCTYPRTPPTSPRQPSGRDPFYYSYDPFYHRRLPSHPHSPTLSILRPGRLWRQGRWQRARQRRARRRAGRDRGSEGQACEGGNMPALTRVRPAVRGGGLRQAWRRVAGGGNEGGGGVSRAAEESVARSASVPRRWSVRSASGKTGRTV